MIPKLLIVDDERGIVDMIQSYFQSQYDILTAYSGQEALQKAGNNPDLILLDINMPDIDGLTVCQKIRDYITCPILFLTARIESGDKIIGFQAGADDYTVKHYHALIHGALNYAVDKNLIPSNPADRIIISKPEPFKGDYYLDSEVLNLFEVIKGHKIELVVLLTAFYGLRRSEVIGLKWSAFDFNHNCFSIRHTVTTCNVKGERVTIKKDKAKNKSSLRTYPLIPFLKERLLEAKKQQEENRKLCGRSYNKEYLGYVCVDVIGNLIKPNYVSSTFGKLLAKNNLRHIRFHDLRHTCASLLLANGVPMEQVKEWLGHSEISTTVDIYGHLQYATKKQSAAAIEQDIVAPMLQNLSAVSP